jgi:hypothetical protein
MISGLTFHGIQIINIDGSFVSEQNNQDSETNSGFCGCNCQDKKYNYLASNIMQKMRKGDEVHVDCQQHQLNAHQQHNHVFTINKNPGYTDAKQYCGKD